MEEQSFAIHNRILVAMPLYRSAQATPPPAITPQQLYTISTILTLLVIYRIYAEAMDGLVERIISHVHFAMMNLWLFC